MLNPFKQYFFSIAPYLTQHEGQMLYAFDDEQRGLKTELFEQGITTMIFLLSITYAVKDIPFQIIFSNKHFADCITITRAEKENGGYWYYNKQLRMIGWLCPMLFKYFRWAPKHIYVKLVPLM